MTTTYSADDYPVTCKQGSKFTRVFTYKPDGTNAANLTGYTARMQVRENLEASATVVDATTENGMIALGGAAGTITITIAHTVTAAFRVGTHRYDLELINPSSEPDRLFAGDFKVTREVTR